MDFLTIKNAPIMPTYGRFDVAFVRGEGCTLYDESGKKYIDFGSGIGVNSVGYAHPKWVKAVSEQAASLAHVSNLYYTLPGAKLAEKLVKIAKMSNVFFSNSGAEANEGAIKLARKYSRDKYGDGRATIVTLVNSFHGRTISTLTATGQDVFHQHFFPFTEGFVHARANDISELEALGNDVCAVFLEPVQGEGGVIPLDTAYLKAVEKLCLERDWLLMCDEVQTGIGRTGKWFAHQISDIHPDVVTFAKGIAGGLPLGGFLANEKCSAVLGAGTHATTFGANPICCAAALATLEILETALPDVAEKRRVIDEELRGFEVRGAGLMVGVVSEKPPREVVLAGLERGLVCLTAGSNVVRLLPPLVIGKEELTEGLKILKNILEG
ncbi:acetylornithine aminotransferase [Clostridia bacterium]|nr:acetylornithine aminotransferase [Clostridia bacterium]